MGTEAAWVPLVLSAVSAAGTAYNTKRTADRQDSEAAAGIKKQAETQRQANALLGKTIQDTLQSTSAPEKATAQQQYIDQVMNSMGQANAGLTQQGLSEDFSQRAGGAQVANADYGATTADLLARMDAPVLQRQREGNAFADTGMDLSVLQGNVAGDQFLTDMRMKGIRRNPYIDIMAGLMSGAAAGYGGGARGAGASKVGPYASGYKYPGTATSYGVRLPGYG